MESLWIRSIEVQNFRSFRGSHTLEIKDPSSRAVYALLAKTGGGKTSLVNAVSWALRGEVISKEMTREGMLRKVRPVIHSKLFEEMDEESRSKVGYPLLNIEAWRNRDLEMRVILRFVLQGDKEITVDFLRFGRIALVYQTLDESEAGVWNQETRTWEPLDSGYRSAIRQGLRIARKQAAPDLIRLPLPAAHDAGRAS